MKISLIALVGFLMLLAVTASVYFSLSPSESEVTQEKVIPLSSEVSKDSYQTTEKLRLAASNTANKDEGIKTEELEPKIIENYSTDYGNASINPATSAEKIGEGSLELNQPKDSGSLSDNIAVTLNNWILAAVIGFLVILTCLLATTILLLKEVRWRKRHGKNEWIIFPDAHMDVLENLKISWHDLNNQLQKLASTSLLSQKENESLSLKTIDSLSKFNTTIDAKKEEIDRLKKGYDYSIKKNSISALIEINDLVSSILAEEISDETKEKLIKVDAYIQSHLEELDVEDFKFASGISIRDLSSDEFEIDSSEVATDADLHEKIKETVKNGYVFVHSNGRNVIKKAKVKVYKKEV